MSAIGWSEPLDDVRSIVLGSGRVRAREEVPERASRQVGEAPATEVLRLVVHHVTALAQRLQVLGPVVEWVMVEMGRRQDHARGAAGWTVVGRHDPQPEPPALAAPPCLPFRIPPPAVAEVDHGAPVRTAAAFTSTLGAAETDRGRQLAPVDRVEPEVLPPDGHQTPSATVSFRRRLTLAIVPLLQPMASWIPCQEEPARSMAAMPALRAVFSRRPL